MHAHAVKLKIALAIDQIDKREGVPIHGIEQTIIANDQHDDQVELKIGDLDRRRMTCTKLAGHKVGL